MPLGILQTTLFLLFAVVIAHPQKRGISGRHTLPGRDRQAQGTASLDFTLLLPQISLPISVRNLPSPPHPGARCSQNDLVNVHVNDVPLLPASADSVFGLVNASDEGDASAHSVAVYLDQICGSVPLDSDSPGHRQFALSVVEVDGAPLPETPKTSPPYLEVFDQQVLLSSDYSLPFPDAESVEKPVEGQTSVSLATSHKLDLTQNVIEKEIQTLRKLQGELLSLESSLARQTSLVQKLTSQKWKDARRHIKDCKSISCVIETAYLQSKECIHLAYLRYAPGSLSCPSMDRILKAQQVSLDSDSLALGQDDLEASEPLLHEYNYSSKESTSEKPWAFPDQSAGHTAAHAVLAVAASLLCLGCLTTCIRGRCCSPRARAERAARREERRRDRQFRCAARRHAWNDWWARKPWRFYTRSRNDVERIRDYEEKRAMIVRQEELLESAMQDEISRLQARGSLGVVNEVLNMAEEGRLPRPHRPISQNERPPVEGDASDGESLPAYRSRSGSGRPPSYREVEEIRVAPAGQRRTIYTPASSIIDGSVSEELQDDTRSVRSFASDPTSLASSVVELSPRHSSESLRTERSVI